MSFTYNNEGIRTSKTVGSVTHKYYLSGSVILAEQWEDNLIVYLYDAAGSPIGMMYRTNAYSPNQWDVFWYEKNLQGDIVAIYSDAGTKLATYTYDAWGNHTVSYTNGGGSTGARFNPIRYRGYYYDTELAMYYLQSRYYDPNTCRFINADGYVSTGQGILGNNMFAYCSNNPIMHIDPSGESWVTLGIVGAVVNVAITFFAAKITQQDYTIVDVGVAAASGFANAIPVVGPLVGGIISGTYAGYATYKNGASVGGAIFAGTVTGIATTASIGNLSGALGIPLDLPLAAITDLVFGTGYNLIAAAVSKAVTSTERNTESSNAVPNFFEDIFGILFA